MRLGARLMTLLFKKTVTKLKEMKTRCKLAEFSKEDEAQKELIFQ
jgi:hypothetical protein